MNSFNRDDLSISTMDYSEATDTRPTKLTRYDTDSALEMDNLSTSGILRTTEGTYPFWSPEMCNGNSSFSGYASDLWAAGVCLYIFTSGRLPFYSESPSTLFQMISSQEKVPLQGLGFSSQLKDLLSQVMNKDPSARAGVGDCLKHEFCTLARMERMKLLGENIRQSTETTITVNTEDKHKAFSIARVAKAAQHKMSKRFQLAREAFATSRPSRISHAFSTLSSSSWMDLTERKKRFIKSISTLSAGAGRAGGKGDTKFHSPKLFKKSLSQIKKMHSSTSATTTSAIVEDSNDDDDENDDKDHDAASTLSNSSGRSKCIVM
jgi:Protein kinase domain.